MTAFFNDGRLPILRWYMLCGGFLRLRIKLYNHWAYLTTIIPKTNTISFNIDICYPTVFDLYLKAENKRIYKNG